MLTKIVDGITIELTPEEEAAQNIEWISSLPSNAQLWSAYQRQALALLVANDTIAIRCVKANIPYPAEWFSCDIALRKIVHAEIGDHTAPLPCQPITRPDGT